MRLRLAAALLAGLLSSSASAADHVVPSPDLSGAAEPVREALTAEAARMSAMLDAAHDAETLAAAWIELGDSYFAHDYFSEAMVAYRAALALLGDRAPLAYRIGMAHMAEGRLEPAIASYATAADLGSDNLRVAALVRRGRALLEQGDSAAALSDFQAALKLAPDSPAVLGGLGRAELAAGNAGAALEHLRRAVEIDPAATRLRQPLGMAYRALGDRAGARQALAGIGEGEPALADPVAAAIMQHSRSPAFFLQTGLTQASRGDFDAAATLIGRAVALAPDDLSIVATYGHVLAEGGHFALARRALEQVTASDRASVDDWLYLGGIEQAEGDLAAAQAAFDAALALEPDNLTAREALARLALHRSEFVGARTTFLALAEDAADTTARQRYRYWAGVAALADGSCNDALADLESSRAGGPPYDPALLQALARGRATCPGVDDGALNEALGWSEQIYQVLPELETSATLAMVYAALGRFPEAIDLQTQAIFEALKTGRLERRPGLQANLERYRDGRPAERAFRSEDPLLRLD